MAVTILFILAFALTGCGSAKTNTSEEPTGDNNNKQKQEQTSKASTDLTTIDGWLTYWNLSEADLKPANFTRLDKAAYSLENDEIKSIGAYTNKKLTDDEVKAWLEKVISKLNSLSDEGKLSNIAKNGEALTADYIMQQSMYIGSGSFTYKGKKASAIISVVPGYLDDADPDEAMPACTLSLSY